MANSGGTSVSAAKMLLSKFDGNDMFEKRRNKWVDMEEVKENKKNVNQSNLMVIFKFNEFLERKKCTLLISWG